MTSATCGQPKPIIEVHVTDEGDLARDMSALSQKRPSRIPRLSAYHSSAVVTQCKTECQLGTMTGPRLVEGKWLLLRDVAVALTTRLMRADAGRSYRYLKSKPGPA
jgi:hypothetical protein